MAIEKYNKIADENGNTIGFKATIDGVEWFVPLDPSNRHYQMIKADYMQRKTKPFKFDFK